MSAQHTPEHTLVQNVSAIICFVENADGTRSVEDILELPCSVYEAPHYYNRYWGQHGVHRGPRVIEAGYTIDGDLVVWPFRAAISKATGGAA